MSDDLKPRFIESLKRNNDQIREDRAKVIGEDSELIYRRRVEDIELKIKRLEREQEGGSILDHIFGGQKATVENQLSQNTGISMDKIGPILAMLAPIIMGYIGKEKQANGVNAGGLGDLLGGILGGAQQQAQAEPANPLNDILGSVLGGQQSGGGLGDILGSVLGGGNQKQSGGLGDLLGGILGGK